MALQDFNGQGSPLDDKRLTKSNTTDAGAQQYRIWHDGQQILVPKGQSISKPLSSENVSANTGVFGDINKGYFQAPVVEFRNTIDYLLFDRFRLRIIRDELPTDPDIDWPDDLGVHTVLIRFNVVFAVASVGYTGRSGGYAVLRSWGKGTNGRSNWVSDVLHFDDYNLTHIRGDFNIVCNPTAGQSSIGQSFTTGQSMHPLYPFEIYINDVFIKNGNSTMEVILKNTAFAVTLQSFTFELLGGYDIG